MDKYKQPHTHLKHTHMLIKKLRKTFNQQNIQILIDIIRKAKFTIKQKIMGNIAGISSGQPFPLSLNNNFPKKFPNF